MGGGRHHLSIHQQSVYRLLARAREHANESMEDI
jgi:hypothetical protein